MSIVNQQVTILSHEPADALRASNVKAALASMGIRVRLHGADGQLEGMHQGAEERRLGSSTIYLILMSERAATAASFRSDLERVLSAWRANPLALPIAVARLEPCHLHEGLSSFECFELHRPAEWERLMQLLRNACGASAALSPPSPLPRVTPHTPIPMMTFGPELDRFLCNTIGATAWRQVDEEQQQFLLSLGCKFEPIVKLVPNSVSPVVIGFECLGLGCFGEAFKEICRRCEDIDQGVLRLCLAIVAVKSARRLREGTMGRGMHGARHLLFSINLDPIMLQSEHLPFFLNGYGEYLGETLVLEINETTTKQYLQALQELHADYRLRFSADDLNEWDPAMRRALMPLFELTKMDCRAFTGAMHIRGTSKEAALDAVRACKLPGKPLVVEGVEHQQHIEFLSHNWAASDNDPLYGQGYALDYSTSWSDDLGLLRDYGLPGGSFLRRSIDHYH